MAYTDRYLQFLQQTDREDRYLAIMEPLDAATDAEATLYTATSTYGTKATDTPASQRFEAKLLRGFENAAAVDMQEIAGILPAGEGGRIRILQRFGDLDHWRTGYWFDGRPIQVLHGGFSEATGELDFADYGEICAGEINGQPAVGLDYVDINVRDATQRFDYPICDRYHRGLSWMLYGDGVDDFVDLGTDAAHDFTNLTWTLEMVFNPEALPPSTTPILSKTNATDRGYRLRIRPDGIFEIQTFQAGPASQTTSSVGSLVVGRTSTLSAQMHSSGACRFYIDGRRDFTAAGHVAPASSSDHLYLLRNNAGSLFLNGFVAEVRLWNVTRTAEQIADCAHRKLTVAEQLLPELVGYWSCGDGSGATLADSSATGADGTITGAVFHRALEGGDSLEGERMKECWGPWRNVSGHLVEANPPIWQLHSDIVNDVLRGREGGAPRGVNNVFTSRHDFLAATTSAPGVDVLVSAGGTFGRAAIPPRKAMTWDVQGDKSDGTYRTAGPDILRYWMTTRGPNPVDDATELDGAAFDAAAAADPTAHQIEYDGDAMLGDLMRQVARSGGWTILRTLETKLWTIHRFIGAEAEAAAAVDPVTVTERDVVQGSLAVGDSRAPAKRVSVYCARNPTQFDSGDISSELFDDTVVDNGPLRQFLLSEFATATANTDVAGIRLQGREIFIDSTIADVDEARAAAQRELALWGGNEQPISILSTSTGLVLDLLKPVYFHYQDEDEDGARQSRLDTSATSAFVLVARGVDLAQGAVRQTFYREDS